MSGSRPFSMPYTGKQGENARVDEPEHERRQHEGGGYPQEVTHPGAGLAPDHRRRAPGEGERNQGECDHRHAQVERRPGLAAQNRNRERSDREPGVQEHPLHPDEAPAGAVARHLVDPDVAGGEREIGGQPEAEADRKPRPHVGKDGEKEQAHPHAGDADRHHRDGADSADQARREGRDDHHRHHLDRGAQSVQPGRHPLPLEERSRAGASSEPSVTATVVVAAMHAKMPRRRVDSGLSAKVPARGKATAQSIRHPGPLHPLRRARVRLRSRLLRQGGACSGSTALKSCRGPRSADWRSTSGRDAGLRCEDPESLPRSRLVQSRVEAHEADARRVLFRGGEGRRELKAVCGARRMYPEQALRQHVLIRRPGCTSYHTCDNACRRRRCSETSSVLRLPSRSRREIAPTYSTGAPHHTAIRSSASRMRSASGRCVSSTPSATRAEVSQKFTGDSSRRSSSRSSSNASRIPAPARRGGPRTSRGLRGLRRTTMPACSRRAGLASHIHVVHVFRALLASPDRDYARHRCPAIRNQYGFSRFDPAKIGAQAVFQLRDRRSNQWSFSAPQSGYVSHMELAGNPSYPKQASAEAGPGETCASPVRREFLSSRIAAAPGGNAPCTSPRIRPFRRTGTWNVRSGCPIMRPFSRETRGCWT